MVTRGRILLNLNRPADAGLAVAGVPTSFVYQNLHSQATTDNQIWSYNNIARRYSVSTGEGTNGLNFATCERSANPHLHRWRYKVQGDRRHVQHARRRVDSAIRTDRSGRRAMLR